MIGEVVAQRVPGDKAHSFFLISCPRHEPAALAVEFSLILNDADSPALGVGRMAAQMEAVAVGQSNLPMIAHPLETLGAPELVIAMIGPLGVDLDLVASALAKALREVTYTSKVIRLSALLSTMSGFDAVLESSPEDRRIESHMKVGTELRTRSKWSDFLALLAVARIRQERQQITGDAKIPAPRSAYILRSLKHRSEVETLRDIYGDGFVAVSVYAPKEQRKIDLAKAIAKSHHATGFQQFLPLAEHLINIDELEEGTEFGQNVSSAFPLGDVFVEASSRAAVQTSVRRFVEIFFGNQFLTPTKDESGLFQAKAAALRSSDLSRQVGAAIANDEGDVIALGCNDVPKANGGLYWAGDSPDGRDFQRGFDPSARAKADIVAETLQAFSDADLLNDKARHNLSETLNDLLAGKHAAAFRSVLIANLLEFGRIVHAEMAAITDAARRGVSLRGASLFCTTFPCHMCARLIIAAGIKRVVYIEPYPKSKTQELYDDSVSVDQIVLTDGRVNFESFVGVAPNRYMSLFGIMRRKDARGSVIEWDKETARPRIRRFVPTYLTLEQKVVDAVPRKLEEAGLKLKGGE